MDELLAEYKRKGFELSAPIMVRSGKEAIVYKVSDGTRPYALKVYKDPEQRTFQKNQVYTEAKFYRAPSTRKAIEKGNTFAKKFLHKSWVRREFHLLEKLYKVGANIPAVYAWTPTSILMKFVGDGEPAPRLSDVSLFPDEAEVTCDTLIKNMKLFFAAGIVHSDLSPYNILWWKEKPYIIDFPQAVDIRDNPNTEMLLRRDVASLAKYFKKLFAVNEKDIYEQITATQHE